MAANEILKFVETDTTTNLLTQAEYAADPQRDIGNQPGIARSKLVNKAMRQASLIAAGIAEYVAGKQALDVTDELTPAQFALMLTDALDAEFVKLSGATMSGALALFGGDTGVTPAQFDNDTSLATTAFVQRALGSFSGVASYAAAATLTVADVGKAILASGGTYALTLPAANAVPEGGCIQVFCSGTAVTVQRAGADVISGASSSTAITLGVGDTITLRSNGATGWLAVEGSARLGSAAVFGASLAANGYQKLPGGLIIQWGLSSPGGAGTTPITFAIAFPFEVYHVGITIAYTGSGSPGSATAAYGSVTNSGFNIGSTSAFNCNWFAIGR